MVPGFIEAEVPELPTLECLGYVDEVGEGKVSQKGVYVVQPIHIQGISGSRSTTLNLLYRPDWFVPGFNPNKLEELYGEEGRKMLAVFRRYIAAKKSMSWLKGLAGSDEKFLALQQRILSISQDGAEPSIEAVRETLRSFLLTENEGTDIGYTLRQRRDKVEGETDENGKAIYELANGYEVQDFWFATADNIKKKILKAKRSEGSIKIAFDPESVPF